MAQLPIFAVGGDPTHTFKGVSLFGVPIRPAFLPGRYYAPFPLAATGVNLIAAAGVWYLSPFFIEWPMTLVGGTIRCATGQAGGAVKTAFWANSPISNLPLGAPLAADNVGQPATASSADITMSFSPPAVLSPGLYWYGTKWTANTTLPSVTGVTTNIEYPWLVGNPNTVGNPTGNGVISFADAYANPAPTFAEGQVFTHTTGVNVPIVGLGT